MKEKGHLAPKRNFARPNETLGPRGHAEYTNKIKNRKIKRVWLRLWGPSNDSLASSLLSASQTDVPSSHRHEESQDSHNERYLLK